MNPDDACLLDPISKRRVGPSGVSTVMLALFALGAVGSMCTLTRTALAPNVAAAHRLTSAAAVLLTGAAVALYYVYYARCRAWTGWFLFLVVSSFAASVVASTADPAAAGAKEDDHIRIRPW